MANLTLGELIAWLKEQNPKRAVSNGFGGPHSDRGDYSNVAFSPVSQTTFGEMLRHAENALDKTFTGYKGGEFVMHYYVDALIGEWGECGENITHTHIRYWLEQTP